MLNTSRARASAQWLALREPADAAARALDLVEQLRACLPPGGLRIHDLGCGTGSMARWLAPLLPGPQHWVMHDRDAGLLPLARAKAPELAGDGARVTAETRQHDITLLGRDRRAGAELEGASLITASALLDTLTEEELARLVAACAGIGCPVLITITVTGRVELTPAVPFDRRVGDAFNAHQRREVGPGRLLGPDAVGAAVAGFESLGRQVRIRPSPWRLGPARSGLVAQWLTDWVGAACEQQPELGPDAAAYTRRRLAEVAAGELSVTVHHQDLLVLPR